MIVLPFLSLTGRGLSAAELRPAFGGAPRLELGQPWRDVPEQAFIAGSVRLGRSSESLLILADLPDLFLRTFATANNQRLWELGDTFEMFLRNPAHPEYFELHVCPAGHRLQLRFPSAEDVATIRREKQDPLAHAVHEPLFTSLVLSDEKGWLVFAEVPFASVSPKPLETLLVSFGRYDYGETGPPVLSSTSAHPVPDFHRQEEWTPISLGNS